MSVIRPTHTCFDDAMRFLEDLGVEHLTAHHHEYVVVHAECVIGDRSYAHAWVEHVTDRTDEGVRVWQAGVLDGVFMFYACRDSRFPFVVRRAWRYTVREAVDHNYKTGHFGPWAPELDPLCNDVDPADLAEVPVTVAPDAVARGHSFYKRATK